MTFREGCFVIHVEYNYLSEALRLFITISFTKDDCCRKTALCNGDQLLDFSVPELVRSQSTLSTDPEVLQNCAGFTLCGSEGLAVGECSAVMVLLPCMLCVQIYCVVCIELLSAEFSSVNTGLGRPLFCKPLCLLNTPGGLATINHHLNRDYLNFQPIL